MNKCPYCQNDIKKGVVECDSRASLRWVEEGKKRSIVSKMRDKECIVIAKRDWLLNRLKVDAQCCEICKKIIIDFY